ncbi:unnamed protein product [Prorocentrum cordatum]|uniref:NAD(+)--protein-arginine ADP-ribosyltransferase n=1 Tax=Prorocentrum cordatum TaxID=2364126 RepID=A0ABN9RMD2_9DINO|nr:unnamed protein product [Polarella glacialis]
MLEGIYDAIASNPDNKFVKLLQQQGGLPGVVLLRRQIPLDAQKYIRDEGNRCNGMGGRKSPIEILEEVPEMEASYDDFKKDNPMEAEDKDEEPLAGPPERDEPPSKKPKRDQKGYESAYYNHIQKFFPNRFTFQQDFFKFKACRSHLETAGLYDWLVGYFNDNVDITSPHCTVYNLANVWHLLLKEFVIVRGKSATFDERHTEMLKGMLKLTLPTDDVSPVLLPNDKAQLAKLSLLRTLVDIKSLGKLHTEVVTSMPKAKAKGKAKPKAKTKVQVKISYVKEGSEEATCNLVDDMTNVILGSPDGLKCLDTIEKGEVDDTITKVHNMIDLCCKYVVKEPAQAVAHQDGAKVSKFKKWKVLRVYVFKYLGGQAPPQEDSDDEEDKQLVVIAAENGGSAPPTGSGTQWDLLAKETCKHMQGAQDRLLQTCSDDKKMYKIGDKIKLWFEENPPTHRAMEIKTAHVAYIKLARLVRKSCGSSFDEFLTSSKAPSDEIDQAKWVMGWVVDLITNAIGVEIWNAAIDLYYILSHVQGERQATVPIKDIIGDAHPKVIKFAEIFGTRNVLQAFVGARFIYTRFVISDLSDLFKDCKAPNPTLVSLHEFVTKHGTDIAWAEPLHATADNLKSNFWGKAIDILPHLTRFCVRARSEAEWRVIEGTENTRLKDMNVKELREKMMEYATDDEAKKQEISVMTKEQITPLLLEWTVQSWKAAFETRWSEWDSYVTALFNSCEADGMNKLEAAKHLALVKSDDSQTGSEGSQVRETAQELVGETGQGALDLRLRNIAGTTYFPIFQGLAAGGGHRKFQTLAISNILFSKIMLEWMPGAGGEISDVNADKIYVLHGNAHKKSAKLMILAGECSDICIHYVGRAISRASNRRASNICTGKQGSVPAGVFKIKSQEFFVFTSCPDGLEAVSSALCIPAWCVKKAASDSTPATMEYGSTSFTVTINPSEVAMLGEPFRITLDIKHLKMKQGLKPETMVELVRPRGEWEPAKKTTKDVKVKVVS